MRFNFWGFDKHIFFIIVVLLIFGVIMVSSVSFFGSYNITLGLVERGILDEPHNHFYLQRTLSHVVIGLIAFIGVSFVPYRLLEKYSKHAFLFSLFLLVFVLFFGKTYNGATGWINIPGLPLFQPTEFFKLALIIYLAYFMKIRRHSMGDLYNGCIPFWFIVCSGLFLIALQPDFGTILVAGFLSLVLFFIGWGNWRYILAAGFIGFVAATAIYSFGRYEDEADRNKLSYISDRIDNFLTDNKEAIENRSINYQTKQGLIAIGSGGFTGLGLGNSVQKYGYLPEAQGDFIFSIIAEESGLIGVALLLSLYIYFMYRVVVISQRIHDLFPKYLILGIASWILIQAFINIGVNLNIMPLTGITLPFISYGGSSLVMFLLSAGIILGISRNSSGMDVKRKTTRRMGL